MAAGASGVSESETELTIRDLSDKGLHSIEFLPGVSLHCLIYDRNNIRQLENLHHYESLTKLSVANNQISDMTGITALRNLTCLNLSDNNISLIQGLRHLSKLTKLNLSHNKIKQIENLNHNTNLQHLDLSENVISSLNDIRGLFQLRTLLLHGNHLTSLRSLPEMLPRFIVVLSLADNNITDLNEISHLFYLSKLEQLSVIGNPCVTFVDSSIHIDYRPFVVNWCVSLQFLDGQNISKIENLKAEWLFSQGRGRHFIPGQHYQLCQYLATVCPTAWSEMDHDEVVKLKCILQQQMLLQQQRQDNSGIHGSRNDRSGASQSGSSPKQVERRSTPSSVNSSVIDKSSSSLLHFGSGRGKAFGRGSVDAFDGNGGGGGGGGHAAEEAAIKQEFLLDDISCSGESQSLLECETRYLPLPTELSPSRGVTLLPSSSSSSSEKTSGPGLVVSNGISEVNRVAVMGHSSNRPVAQNHRIAAVFGPREAFATVMKPEPSVLQPQSHSRASSSSSTSKAFEFSSGNALTSAEQQPTKAAVLNSQRIRQTVADAESPSDLQHSDAGRSASSLDEVCEKLSARIQMRQQKRQVTRSQSGSTRIKETDAESVRKTKAAVALQAFWRGCLVRRAFSHHLARNIQAMRSEDHIRLITSILNSQSGHFDGQKLFFSHQVELMKHLVKDVKSLQDWKNQVISSHDQFSTVSQTHGLTATSSSCSNLDSTRHSVEMSRKISGSVAVMMDPLNPPRSLSSPKPTCAKGGAGTETPSVFQFPAASSSSSLQLLSSQREMELESVCQGLQKQVDELKDMLSSLSSLSLVFCGSNVVSADVNDETRCAIEASENDLPAVVLLPPFELSVDEITATSAVLKWKHSLKTSADSKSRSNCIVGYRIYLCDEPRAMVSSVYHTVVVNSLTPSTVYKVYLKSIGSLGESPSSEAVEFKTLPCAVSKASVSLSSSHSSNLPDKPGNGQNSKDTLSKRNNHNSNLTNKSLSSEHKTKENFSADQLAPHKHRMSNTAPPANAKTLAKTSFDSRSSPRSTDKPSQTCPAPPPPSAAPPFLKDEPHVRPMSTYPSVRKSQNFTILENKMEMTEATKELFLTGILKTNEPDVNFAVEGEESQGDTDEMKYTPKPPDDTVMPRRNSLSRRSSLRRRNNGKTSAETMTTNDETLQHSSSVAHFRSPSEPVMRDAEDLVHSRSRQLLSASSEVRSSSAGAQRKRHLSSENTVFTTDKPPSGPRDSSLERNSGRKRTTSGDRITERLMSEMMEPLTVTTTKCRSELFAAKQSEKTKPQVKQMTTGGGGGVGEAAAAANKTNKSFLVHNRSKSDFKMLPDRPKSPVRVEKSPTMMSTPQPAPSSPQLRRSSSFSIAIRDDERIDGNTQLRQCISLETLRAVKKSSVDHRQSVVTETKQTAEKPGGGAGGGAQQTQLIGPGSARIKERSVLSGASEVNRPTVLSSADASSRLSSPAGRRLSGDESAPVKTKKSDSTSKSRLGNKASNLFSQLHKRISPNK